MSRPLWAVGLLPRAFDLRLIFGMKQCTIPYRTMTEDCESCLSEIKAIQIQLTINIVATFINMNVSGRAWFLIQKNITM